MNVDILIVGAGLAGLMAAQVVRSTGLQLLLVDKGASVGGRLATRRIAGGRADHGAQFFSVRSARFQSWVDGWQRAGLVYVWSNGWSDASLIDAAPDGNLRYAVRDGMNALAKELAQGLPLRTGTRLISVARAGQEWLALSADGARFQARALLLTPPVPQSLALLAAGEVPLAWADRTALERIRYAPCLAGLFHVEGPVYLPEPGALQRPKRPISWVADNQRKGISPEAQLVTVHASAELSRQLWDRPDSAALETLRQQGLEPQLSGRTRLLSAQLKRWRYALPEVVHPQPLLVAQGLPPLIWAGDAFAGPRVEGAALSGLAAGEALLRLLLGTPPGMAALPEAQTDG